MRRAFGTLALLTGMAAQGAEPESPALAEAKAFYRRFEYEKCAERLKRADANGADAEMALYEGICQYYVGKLVPAQAAFERALRLDPKTRLPPYSSPKLVGFFSEIAAEMPLQTPPPDAAPATPKEATPAPDAPAESPPSLPIPAPPPPAPAASVTVSSTAPVSPSTPWLPVGLGSVSVAALGGGIVFGVEARRYESTANGTNLNSDYTRYGHAAKNAALGANVCYGVAATTAAAALLTWLWGPR